MATNDLKVSEAAKELRVHAETVRAWLREGRFLHAYQLGRRGGWRIPPDDLTTLKEQARSASRALHDRDRVIGGSEAPRRLPRTIGVVEDKTFQASESEAYMHEHRDRERATAE